MSVVYQTKRRVEFRDTDAAGLVHFSVFFNFMEVVEHEFLRSRGLSVFTSDEQGPISWPRVAARCDYRGAVKFEDVLDVELTVARLGEKSVTYSFSFTHAGQPVADGEVTAVCCRLDPNGPPRSIAIPSLIRQKLETTP
jgi:acyl-CoA thioester hydrolase